MGPLPKGSGRTGEPGWYCTIQALQWGRCRKAAEGFIAGPCSRARSRFNGAAAERQRKAGA